MLLAAKLCVSPQQFRGARTCSRFPITTPSLVGLGFYPPPGRRKTLSVFVCPSRFETSELVCPISPWSWGTDIILMPLDRGKLVVVHSFSTFSDCRQLSTSLNAEFQKNCKNWGFSPPEGDRINRSRRHVNVHCGSVIAHQIWPSSVKGGRCRSPHNSKFAKIVIFGHPKPTQ